jgi:hypothetical protein
MPGRGINVIANTSQFRFRGPASYTLRIDLLPLDTPVPTTALLLDALNSARNMPPDADAFSIFWS